MFHEKIWKIQKHCKNTKTQKYVLFCFIFIMFGLCVLRLLCLIRNADCSEWKEIFLTRFIWVHFSDKTGHFSTWSILIGPRQESVTTHKTASKAEGTDIKCYFTRDKTSLISIVRFKNQSTIQDQWRFIFSKYISLPPNT